MRVSLLTLTALAALALTACDGRRAPPPTAAPAAKAEADCCCIKQCKDAPAEVAEAPPAPPPAVNGGGGGYSGKVYRKTWRKGGGYRRRTGTEGVGYLDEGYAGGRYVAGGSVRYEERYSETERRSETYEERRYGGREGYAYAEGGYGYAEGGYGYREGDGRRGGKGGKKRRNYDGSYVGTDRDGYLTWPGKTP